MKRTIKVSQSLIEHWNGYLVEKGDTKLIAGRHRAVSKDMHELQNELEKIPPAHFRKLQALTNEYMHWIFLLYVIGDEIDVEDITF